MLVDNLGGFLQCFADGFKVFVVFSHDFFQTLTFKVVVIDIFLGCFFFDNLAIFIFFVDDVSGFESVDVLGIFVGSN